MGRPLKAPDTPVPPEARWLRWSIALVWLATGCLVLHPYYRAEGVKYLALVHLPSWVMVAACIGEVLLGLRLAAGNAGGWLALGQVVVIAGFTTILTWADPWLLVHPFGMLTKNLPLLAVIGTVWLLEREGWSRRALWLLRGGLAAIWITEGLFPKILFQQPMELAVVADSGLVSGDPAVFLRLMGAAQVLSGLAVLLLHGRWLQWLLFCQIAEMVVLPLLISLEQPLWWLHPFQPFTKNVPILVGSIVLWKRLRDNVTPSPTLSPPHSSC